uniref:atlastin-like isoform X1 n=1 Tax=Styela clava TaxID=7725 RepID=UPI0019395F71|nr:atlastin-like isoform X1 [Styela clava]
MGNTNTQTEMFNDDSEVTGTEYFHDFNPDPNGEVVQILKQDEDNKLVLDQNALVGMLRHPSIGNRPVSIITIAGPFRTGKSFMMNFFLRYLRNKGYTNADWMGSKDTPLNDGFHWRGGVEKVTTGISVWSQPIIVRREGGREIAVLLCDSQGTFGNQADKGDDMKVFTMSLMMSSVLIYNLMSKIQTDNLEYLKLFINYTKRCTKSAGKLSQKLFFLVRDWVAPFSFEYGDAEAKKYLATVLEGDELDKTFKAISCYLMPAPGKTTQVFHDRQFDGKLGDLDIEFRDHLSPLAACLLDPQNLVAKVQSGEMLINIIVKSWENIKKFETPNGIDELYQDHHCLEEIFKTMKSYQQDEAKILGDKSVNAKTTEKQLSKARNRALLQFEKNCADCSNKNIVNKAKNILHEQLKGARTQYLLQKELIELDKKKKTQSTFQNIKEEYLFRMENQKALLGRDDGSAHHDVKKEMEENFLPTPDNEDFKSIKADLDFLFKRMDYDCSFKQLQHTIEVNNAVIKAAKHYEEYLRRK